LLVHSLHFVFRSGLNRNLIVEFQNLNDNILEYTEVLLF
jgi:hypothetical protein